MTWNEGDELYNQEGRVGDKPTLTNYVIVLACGHKVEYQTYPNLAPIAGDAIICYEHGHWTTVVRLE